MATADVQEIRATSYVGFDSITQQIEHKLLKRGFQFNVIVVGASRSHFLISQSCFNLRKRNISILTGFWSSGQTGLGKSTLINTIFASHLIDSKGRREADEPVRQTTEIQTVSHGAVFSLLLFSVFVTLRVASLTRMPRLSYHGKRGATAP
jgi:septin 3/9/12